MTSKRKRREHLHSVVLGLEKRLSELLACEPRRREEFAPVPKVPAIYLLSEKGTPAYVGRTRNLRQRLGDHMRPGNDRYTATFAFRLAKQGCEQLSAGRTDAELESHPKFKPVFMAAKNRVSKMKVQYVEIRDPIEQTLFEVYAAESLGTKHNSFETH